MSESKQVLILGSGSWGTALALAFARQGHKITIWGHDAKEVSDLTRDRENKHYLPGFPFPPNIEISGDLQASFRALDEHAFVLIAVPSHAFAETTKRMQPYLKKGLSIFWASKGLAQDAALLSEVFHQNCGKALPIGILSGPSFALEVAKGLPTAVTLATDSEVLGKTLQNAFHSENFRIYLSQDIIGVQLGGTVKNVLAIAVGMSDGLGFGANARAALMTRGLAELSRLGYKLGARPETFLGLSGVGDVVLTCTDNLSRNRRFGLAVGQGKAIDLAEKEIGQVVEGKKNVVEVLKLAERHNIEMPICQEVYAVLYQRLPVSDAMNHLLSRDPKTEN